MKIKNIYLIFFLLYIGACTENMPQKMPLNPNGDSELALLMREMFEDGMRIKEQIEKGEQPKVLKKFEAIHTAAATQPEKVNDPAFDAFADTYLGLLKNLESADKAQIPQLHNVMVESCMNCHRTFCPGPMVRIKKLYLPEN